MRASGTGCTTEIRERWASGWASRSADWWAPPTVCSDRYPPRGPHRAAVAGKQRPVVTTVSYCEVLWPFVKYVYWRTLREVPGDDRGSWMPSHGFGDA